MWFASDSRLSGNGIVWDRCPKLASMPRSSTIAGFAGDTQMAYPLLWQSVNAIASYGPASSGLLDFFDVTKHLETVFNSMLAGKTASKQLLSEYANSEVFASSGDALVLGGYSASDSRLVIRALQFEPQSRRWRWRTIPAKKRFGVEDATLYVYGDRAARERFIELVGDKLCTLTAGNRGLNCEPLALLCDYLTRDEEIDPVFGSLRRSHTVGGPPQVVRSVIGGEPTPVVVRWSDGDFLIGRRLESYERTDLPLLTFNPICMHAPGAWP